MSVDWHISDTIRSEFVRDVAKENTVSDATDHGAEDVVKATNLESDKTPNCDQSAFKVLNEEDAYAAVTASPYGCLEGAA